MLARGDLRSAVNTSLDAARYVQIRGVFHFDETGGVRLIGYTSVVPLHRVSRGSSPVRTGASASGSMLPRKPTRSASTRDKGHYQGYLDLPTVGRLAAIGCDDKGPDLGARFNRHSSP